MEGPAIEEKSAAAQEKTGGEPLDLEAVDTKAQLEGAPRELAEMKVREKRRDLVHQGALDRITELETQLKQAQEAMKAKDEDLRIEQMTGLLNRFGFYESVGTQFETFIQKNAEGAERRAGRTQESEQDDFGFIFLDIDKFKNINDTYGHYAGDAAIRLIAKILKDNLRQSDKICRWGGEEFVIAAIGKPAAGGRLFVSEKLRKAIENAELIYDGKRIPLTASIGTSRYQGEQADPEVPPEQRTQTILDQVIKRAGDAMKVAKAKGRNQVVVAEAGETAPQKETPAP